MIVEIYKKGVIQLLINVSPFGETGLLKYIIRYNTVI